MSIKAPSGRLIHQDASLSVMDGVINLHKPPRITSAQALYSVRSITGQRKSGHAGTLDPAATGVLVLCMGKATKLVEAIMDLPKVYRATARLDVTSQSFDSDRPLIPLEINTVPNEYDVRAALHSFEGVIDQVPPKISAVKVAGRAAYRRTLRGEQVELQPRSVRVYWIHVQSYCWPQISFELCCGRGTYVRSLIRDLGEKLQVGGCLTSLVRERVGPFSVLDAWSIDRLRAADSADEYLIDLDHARRLVCTDGVSTTSDEPRQ
ncbi:MAG: tRNA pseudouridine(55) synthase TruB [Phycisphaerae bacterium]